LRFRALRLAEMRTSETTDELRRVKMVYLMALLETIQRTELRLKNNELQRTRNETAKSRFKYYPVTDLQVLRKQKFR
jgi:hypothetical protein